MKFNIKWNVVWEAAKEPLRWFILSVVSYIITLLLDSVPGISDFIFEYIGLNATLVAGVLTYILRAIDKYLYTVQKQENPDKTHYGLTQF